MGNNLNMQSAKTIWRNIAVAVFAVAFALIGLGVTVLPTKAATGNFVVVGEIYGRAGNIQKLYDLIGGSEYTTFTQIKELATAKTNAAQIRAKTYQKTNAQDVQVTFGGQIWDVVYLSTTNEENPRPILTLWLHDNFCTSQWSKWYAHCTGDTKYPSSMYGTSYVRALLNNGGKYSGDGGMELTDYEPVADYALQDFLPDGKYGDLVVTPSYVEWQRAGQSFSYVMGSSYDASNQNWGSEDGHVFTSERISGRSMNFFGCERYDIWKDDNLWLPSFSEAMSINRSIFVTSAAQCYSAGALSLIRTSDFDDTTGARSLDWECFSFSSGGEGNVRPALHLDLAALNLTADNLDDLTVTYDATDQNIANWESKPEWYSDNLQITYTKDGEDVTDAKKDVGEYIVTVKWADYENTITMTVLPQAVTVSDNFIAVDRVYKRERAVELDTTAVMVTGLIKDDAVGITYQGFMDDKNAGEKPVTVTATLTGDSAKNYVLTASRFMTTVTITPQTVSIINVKAKDKEYDGTARAILDTTDIKYTGLIEGDDLTVLVSGEYEQKNVGDNLTVTLNYSGLDGLDKGNYQIALEKCQKIIEDCNIKQRAITVTLNDQVVKIGDKKILTARVTSGSLATGDSADTVYQLSLDDIDSDELDYANLDIGAYKITGKCINDNYYIDFIDGTYRVLSEEDWEALQPKEEPKDNNWWLIIIIVMAIAAFIGALVGIGLVIRSHDKDRDSKPKKEKKEKNKKKAETPTDTKPDTKAKA